MNKDVPQEKGFEEDIGRKGSENNASSEVFSKDKKKKKSCSMSVQQKQSSLTKKSLTTGNRRKIVGIQGILKIKNKKMSTNFEVAMPNIFLGSCSSVGMFFSGS